MARGARRSAVKTAVQLRISLMEHTPTIWRRLLVPGEITLAKLHPIFQAAMGWEDYHLHYFEIDDERYGVPDEDWEIEDTDEEGVTFSDVIKAPMRFFYEYDFGDSCVNGH
jgi:pRiA4b ORF-3-like protein